ncbi:MAG: hypothetical protein HY841_02970 [Bacteroidetes bacterium]|nr:hypothetical protein [Bacteroidota bacterium]
MKKYLLLLFVFLLFSLSKIFSQTVYVNQSGNHYHTRACKLYTKNFEAVPLWKARDVYQKKPCEKCHPPTKDIKSVPKKKSGKTKPKQTTPVKK